ncbi:MAG: FAD-binding oxidoreductase, partial [Bacteroidetes bacterium]|nr:FAD-binding oxidoreductase [Bacteroidota bacterium]
MISFWEKESFLNYDYIIVGSGITGLSTAISIVDANPTAKIAILERGIFPSGASTRNAGFACYGSAAEILEDIKIVGLDKALELVELRKKGLEMLRARLGDEAIGYEEWGGGEVIEHAESITIDEVENLNNNLKDIFGKQVFSENILKAEELGFETQGMKYFIQNHLEGQINTGKMMLNLIKLATTKGIMI